MEDFYPELPCTFAELRDTLGIDPSELSEILDDCGAYCKDEKPSQDPCDIDGFSF